MTEEPEYRALNLLEWFFLKKIIRAAEFAFKKLPQPQTLRIVK
jgi:hypothetical protein